ncbi:MAG: immune inhibitor A [Anaerolineaceae bacterium]|nr:immune inhibitor A [Anaerolineaceae bacterium]
MKYKHFHLILTILITIFTLTQSAYSEKDPLPNSSYTVAAYFGDINESHSKELPPEPVWNINDTREFLVLNITEAALKQCTARIFLTTENTVYWYDTEEIQQIPEHITVGLKAFDSYTLPMLRSIFGTENIPGTDNDPRFHVLFTGKIGEAYNGYFSAEDTADPQIRPGSNGMELLFLNTRLISQGADAVLDTLAHEYQHMIHFNYDQNEQSFINEGLSGLAEYLALGTMRDSFIRSYLSDTGKSLIWWPESGTNAPYYGSSFLFTMYLYDRFGEDFIHELVYTPENGLNGIDIALRQNHISLSADELFQQWTAALLGRLTMTTVKNYDYQSYPFPQNGIYRDIRQLNCGMQQTHEIPQYGLHFYESTCDSPFRITVEGAANSSVTSLEIPGSESPWWSGAVSNSMSLLSRDFDLSQATAPIFFEYDVVYDIERDYDYYYLLLKDDEGAVTRLSPATATEDNPAQMNRGKGTTGKSDGVRQESIDLSAWAGQHIQISFVYLTDTATVGDGVLIDNIVIKAIGFSDNAESDNDGWRADGYQHIQASMPQHYSLVILHPQSYGVIAEYFLFEGGEPFTADCLEGGCTFAVSAVERDVRSRTSYTVLTNPMSYR